MRVAYLMSEFPVVLKLTHPSDLNLIKKAQWFARQPGIKLLKTSVGSPHHLQNSRLPVLHITRKGTFLETEEIRFNFHPNMALIRLIQLGRGESDRFLSATELQQGDTFLDATLGLGTDALVAAWKVGNEGRVIAIEHSAILAALIREGLSSLAHGLLPSVKNPEKAKAWLALAEAARRIEVLWGDHKDFLANSESASVDVIYFDPMFRHTREQSSSIRPLHQLSNPQPLQKDVIFHANRVARKRVVLKERKESDEFSRLGFSVNEGGRYSQVDYGIIQCRREYT